MHCTVPCGASSNAFFAGVTFQLGGFNFYPHNGIAFVVTVEYISLLATALLQLSS